MKSQTLEILSQILTNNIGNKLTLELAHGIVSVLNQYLPDEKVEEQPVDKQEDNDL